MIEYDVTYKVPIMYSTYRSDEHQMINQEIKFGELSGAIRFRNRMCNLDWKDGIFEKEIPQYLYKFFFQHKDVSVLYNTGFKITKRTVKEEVINSDELKKCKRNIAIDSIVEEK